MGTKGSWWQQLAEGTAKPHGQRREPAHLWGRVAVHEHTPSATICCCFFFLPTLLSSSRPNFPFADPRAPRCPSFFQPLSCSCCHSHVLSSSSAPADAHGCATDPLTWHIGVSELLHPQKLASAFGQCAIFSGDGTLWLQGWTQLAQTAAGASHPCPQPGQGSSCAPSLQLAAHLARISSCPCRMLSIRPERLHYPLSERAQLPSWAQHRSAGRRAAAFHALAASSSWKSPAGPSSRCSPELLLLLLHQPAATAAPGPAEPSAWGRSHEAVASSGTGGS